MRADKRKNVIRRILEKREVVRFVAGTPSPAPVLHYMWCKICRLQPVLPEDEQNSPTPAVCHRDRPGTPGARRKQSFADAGHCDKLSPKL